MGDPATSEQVETSTGARLAPGGPGHKDALTVAGVAARAFLLLFVACLLVVVYLFLFQVTKPSPLSTSSTGQLASVFGYSVLGALALTLLALPVAVLADWLTQRRSGSAQVLLGSLVISTAVYSLGFLALMENFVYTLTGVGLKTGDSLLVKLGFGTSALVAGTLLARLFTRTIHGRCQHILLAWGSPVLVLPACVLVAADWVATEKVPAAEAGAGSNLVNVVILSSDGINADQMSVYGYPRETTPFLESKASEFRLFENAFTNNGNTTGSITSLLTGRSPLSTGVVYPPDLLEGADTFRSLPHMLGDLGYYRSNWAVPHYADGQTQNLIDAFDVDNGYRSADSLLSALPLGTGPTRWFLIESLEGTWRLALDVLGVQGLENPYSQVGTVAGDTLQDEPRLRAVVNEIRTEPRFFINTHFMVSHGPTFVLSEPFFSRGDEQSREQGDGWARDFYDDSIRQFDSYVGRVYEVLRESGKLDRTIVIVTSDHGMKYDASKRVPLMIRFPQATPSGPSNLNVQRLDVAPTILDVLGVAQPRWMEAKSLLQVDNLPADRQFTAANINMESREVSQRQGFRMPDSPLLLTAIRCDSFVRLRPNGDVVRGHVSGSTAQCTTPPDVPSRYTQK